MVDFLVQPGNIEHFKQEVDADAASAGPNVASKEEVEIIKKFIYYQEINQIIY